MSFWIMMLIMFVSGLIGGTVNFLLPSNISDDGKYKDPWWKAVILGLGATLLVPLFLEIAQSKLLETVYLRESKEAIETNQASRAPHRDTLIINNILDSTRRVIRADTTRRTFNDPTRNQQMAMMPTPGKSYLLYFAYCVLAAAAGFRFIQMLLKNVVKEEQLEAARTETRTLKESLQLKSRQDLREAQKDEIRARERFLQSTISQLPNQMQPHNLKEVLNTIAAPVLKEITHPNDPQKDRFGGQSSRNGRQLMATVIPTNDPEFFEVTFWVEGTADAPLPDKPVLFYIHPTFHPSVLTIMPDRFVDGKAMHKVDAWGAFTIGAITDDGQTMLELDLSLDQTFPAKFRSR